MRLKVTAGEAASWRNATFFCFTKNKKRALSVRAPEKSRGQTKDKFSCWNEFKEAQNKRRAHSGDLRKIPPDLNRNTTKQQNSGQPLKMVNWTKIENDDNNDNNNGIENSTTNILERLAVKTGNRNSEAGNRKPVNKQVNK